MHPPIPTLRPGVLARFKSDGAYGSKRCWVAVQVSAADIARGVQVRAPGVHLVSGCWYAGQPLTAAPYGKVIDMGWLRAQPAHRRERVQLAGRIGTRFAARRRCA